MTKEKIAKIAKLDKNYMPSMREEYKLTPIFLALRLVKPNSKVLSIGCGAGREVSYLVKELNCKVTALDFDKDMIKSSKELEPNAEYLLIDALRFERSSEYDFIVCLWNTINFMEKEERQDLIKLCYINLKEGGQLIITSSSINQKFMYKFYNLYHNMSYYYSLKEIDYWFEQSMFDVETLDMLNTNLIVARKLI